MRLYDSRAFEQRLGKLELLVAQRHAVLTQTPKSNPLQWAEETATIAHPLKGIIAFKPYWYQENYLKAYDTPMRFVLKARQIGFSQVLALEALYTAMHTAHSTVLFISRNQPLAANMLRYCYIAYYSLRDPMPLTVENQKEMGFTNGSRILSLPANPTAGRGFAATVVYLDEYAYAAYDEEIYQSISPSLAHGGRLVIASTPNGQNNQFAKLYRQQSDFTYFFHPWHHCPAYYTDDERAAGVLPTECAWYLKERTKFTAQQWAAEYDCDFVGSGVAVFLAVDIDAAAANMVGDQPWQPKHFYLAAVDIGRRQDATVINVIDYTTTPYQRVYHERIEQLPYPYIQRRIEHVAGLYRLSSASLIIESNGVGDPLIENLQVGATPFNTNEKTKSQAIMALQLLLENRSLKAAWTDHERNELLQYQWDDKSIQQDCVMSLAIAAWSLKVDYAQALPTLAQRQNISLW